jgi:hypothetical protein
LREVGKILFLKFLAKFFVPGSRNFYLSLHAERTG